MKKVDIETSWYELLKDEFEKDYFLMLRKFIKNEYKTKKYFLILKIYSKHLN